ncbi:hypothetical protein MEX01_40730 [Methylorubrum extorquens]|uniref:hypothetical protein n=1 Tax=Methylorubrum extorquens TaxID=408 RepID=UPI001173E311|nr:hypothetical protein [Methylorubrum extorquens]GEL43482.1 hypothetical protein MEX01_40730 [Methylorubrum extorquens]
MLPLTSLRLAAAAACLWLAAPHTSWAQNRPNLLVMSEDADEEAVPRGNRIYTRVIRELSETMNVRGYNVYDETAIGMGITEPNRVRRRDTELIDVARSIPTPPLDVMVIFEIYASAQKSMYSDIVRPEVRIPGRMLNVRTGQMIGSFEVSGLQLPPLPQGCDRECLLERTGAEARVIARDLASALTQKLDGFQAPRRSGSLVPQPRLNLEPEPSGSNGVPVRGEACGGFPAAYALRFSGFSAQEIQSIEEYISAFRCYEQHRPVRASANEAEYWYETRSDPARLNRNLRLMLDHMNRSGQVTSAGNSIIVTNVPTR